MIFGNGWQYYPSYGSFFGVCPALDIQTGGNGEKMRRYTGSEWSSVAGDLPAGTGFAGANMIPAIASGAISGITYADTSLSASLLRARLLSSTISINLSTSAALSLIASLSGSTSGVLTLEGNLSASAGQALLSGTVSGTLTATGSLSLKVGLSGTASATFNCDDVHLSRLLSISGTVTNYAENSPQNIASAVWAAGMNDNRTLGSTGETLFGAGGGSSPTLIAEAVLDQQIESNINLKQALQILTAVSAGKTTIVDLGGNLAEVIFRSTDDTADRVTASMDESERTGVVLDV